MSRDERAGESDVMGDYDQRIVDLYDGDNPNGADHAYYQALADRIDARTFWTSGAGQVSSR